MKAAVTGASGFIGSVLVRELLDRGCAVRAVMHQDNGSLADLDIERVTADVREPDTLPQAVQGIDTVFHLASVISLVGDRGGLVSDTNIEGARNIAKASLAAGVGRFVHFSSIHAFDLRDAKACIDEDSPRAGDAHPIYDRTKWAGEQAVREVIAQGLDGVIVHPSGVIGPGDHQPSRIGQVLLDLERGKLPALVPGGFDWVDVRDVVSGAIGAGERGRTGESYLLSGHWHSSRELAEFGAEISGAAPPRMTVPMWMVRSLAPFGDLWGHMTKTEPQLNSDSLAALRAARQISHQKAADELGHQPRAIRTSVHDAYRWFDERNMLSKPLGEV